MKKTLLVVLALVLVAALSVGLTMAYLQDTTEVVTNTFTVGNVTIDLDESKVDEYGVVDAAADPVKANTYKLIPGHTYTKNPTIHVADCEDCWVFVRVENEISAIEGTTTIASQMAANWTEVDDDVYAYNAKVTEAGDIVVFTSFTVADNKDLTDYAGKTIKVTGYAVQADGFGTAQAAWDATFGK